MVNSSKPTSTAGRRVALVIGGSGGIGAASAAALAEEGFDLALSYRSNAQRASELAEQIRTSGAQVMTSAVEFADPESVARAVADAVAQFGRLDVALYAGGPWVDWLFASEVSVDQFSRLLLEDAVPCFAMAQAAIPHLRQTSGCVLAVSTTAVRRTIKRDLLAAAPKAAVELLIRNIALEEGRHGIRANAVAVGPTTGGVYHELVRRGLYTDDVIAHATSRVPLGRMGSEVDVANAVAFLASDRAQWITGQTLSVDGGYSL
jgi:3-oxoacyl-[acyl-carrier protein] reductase